MKNENPIIFIAFVSDLNPTVNQGKVIFMGKDKKFYKFLPNDKPTQAPPIIQQYGSK
jgi:hypothetical protein